MGGKSAKYQTVAPARITIWVTALSLLFSGSLHAQTDTQLWLEWQVSYPFGGRYLVENTFTYQTLLSGGESWRGFSISPTFEYTMTPLLDLTFEVPVGYVRQTDTRTSFDISPLAGARINITQNRKVNFRILPRVQSRNFQSLETGEWEYKGRFRLKAEVWIAVNKPNLFYDKLWYVFADHEEFIVVDEHVDERFANLRRSRLGAGYRLSYKHRFEAAFTLQHSRDEINGDFSQTDNVFQIRYKMYLNPPKVLDP